MDKNTSIKSSWPSLPVLPSHPPPQNNWHSLPQSRKINWTILTNWAEDKQGKSSLHYTNWRSWIWLWFSKQKLWIHYRTSVPLNCSPALNCMDPSKRPQTIPASSIALKEPWVLHLPCKHVGASHKSPKQLFSTTEVSSSPGSWLKDKDIGMMCHYSSIDATCVFLPAYLLTNWTGLNATEIIIWAKWDISKGPGRRPVPVKSPKQTDSSSSGSKSMPFQGAAALTGTVWAWLVSWGFFVIFGFFVMSRILHHSF